MKKTSKYIYYFLSLLIIVVSWFVLTYFNFVNQLFLPKLSDTIPAFIVHLSSSETYSNLFATTYRALFGLFLSVLIGVPFGLLIAKVKPLYDFFEIPIEFFRAIPSSALFPLFILMFGIGDASKIAIVFYACSLIMIINTFYGAIPNPERLDRINMLKTMNATQFQIFKFVIFKDALPNISAGIRVSLSLSFVLVVVTEMFLSSNNGIGKMLYDYYLQYYIPQMYSTIIILGLTGFLLNKLYIFFERKYIFWQSNN